MEKIIDIILEMLFVGTMFLIGLSPIAIFIYAFCTNNIWLYCITLVILFLIWLYIEIKDDL